MRFVTAIFPLTLLVLAGNAVAHEYWVDANGSAFTLLRGHLSSGHAGSARVAYDQTKVRHVVCIDENGQERSVSATGSPLRVEAPCAVVRFHLIGGFWTKTAWETVNRPRSEVPGAMSSWYSEETVSHVERWRPALAKAAAGEAKAFVLNLLTDPAHLRPGDKFTVLALIDGRPRADIAVAYDDEPRGSTDNDGRISLRVRHGGIQAVRARFKTPRRDGRADHDVRSATLSFRLP